MNRAVFCNNQVINKVINMFTKLTSYITAVIVVLVCMTCLSNAKEVPLVYRFSIMEEITPAMARKAAQAVDEAVSMNAACILIEMNTYGGMLDAADSIRTKLLNCPVPVLVFINNNAASAGALIALACNRIYMRTGSSMGAATVVNQQAEALPDKYQSYMRAMMRSTAEARHRDPHIAEAMVDPRIYIPGVNDSGKVLTFTPSEAMKNGFCDGMAENWRQVLGKEQINDYKTFVYDPTWVENIIGILIHPAISGILILVMLGGLYFEMQHPGIGFPLIAGILAAILYFAPLYLEGLAANWEILVFIVGMILIALEIFVIPGFGITGILGIFFTVGGLAASMLNNQGFDFTGIGPAQILTSVAIVVLAMVASLVMFLTLGKGFMHTPAFKRMVLQNSMTPGTGMETNLPVHDWVGQEAQTTTSLRPSGKILFRGEILTASAEFGFIEKDKTVIITRYDGISPMVREK